MLQYVYGFLSGFAFGAVISLLKFVVVWRPLFNKKRTKPVNTTAIMGRLGIGNLINILALLAIFLLRQQLPFSFMWALVGAGAALVILSRLYPMTKVMSLVMPEEAGRDHIYEPGAIDIDAVDAVDADKAALTEADNRS